MATPFHTTVSLDGMTFPESQFTFRISGSNLTAANTEGKVVSLDTTAADTVKLAADGDNIIGRVVKFEARVNEGVNLVTIATRFINNVPVKSGETVLVGDTVVGAGNGEVKTFKVTGVSAPRPWDNYVVEVGSGTVVVAFRP